MKYYLTPNGDIRALDESGSQDGLIDDSWVEKTLEQAKEIISSKSGEEKNYSSVSRLKLKRKLEEITEEGETDSLWVQLRALMVANPDMWDEWLITGDIDIDDPMTISAYTAMGKDRQWMQDLINEINTEQA